MLRVCKVASIMASALARRPGPCHTGLACTQIQLSRLHGAINYRSEKAGVQKKLLGAPLNDEVASDVSNVFSSLMPPKVRSRPAVLCNASGSAAAPQPSDNSFEQSFAKFATLFTRGFPLWVILAAVSGYHKPDLFLWFDNACVTNGLMFVMTAMGLTLTFKEIGSVFTKQPQLLALGMVLQYTVLPLFGFMISRYWGLERGLAVGVALVSCMPGGTASNIVAYLAKGDMPLSIMMTTASTLAAIVTTPVLTSLLVGTLVPVNATAMFLSVLQLVLAPVLVGCCMNQFFPDAVARIKVYTPFLATLVVILIVGSMIGSNAAVVGTSGLQIVGAVFLLHSAGFGLGYWFSKALGLSNKIARTNSIEVGMQSSALAAVLAKVHFASDPTVVAPCVLSACTHATLGSLLAGYWASTLKDEES